MSGPERVLRYGQVTLLAASGALAGVLWHAADWRSWPLFLALLAFAIISQPTPLASKHIQINGAFMGIVLAAVLLGPAPAFAIGVTAMLVDTLRRRRSWRLALPNISTFGAFAVAAGATFRLVDGPALLASGDVLLIPVVAGVFLLANLINFLLIALDIAVADGQPVRRSFTTVYADIFPVEFAVGVLTGGVAQAYALYGQTAIFLLALVALVFQYLLGIAFRAVERGEELEQRNQELATLQVGLISTMLKTLSLRDHMTARHSAAVARYSREVAHALGLDAETRETIHTAALFHDIGKFIFPDSILCTDRRLTDDDFAIVRRHPVVGADLIAEIDGYDDVAAIVRSHHERIDGRGYPDGLLGDEIPLGSRIIAVADVYDVLTARDTYRKPVSSPDAIAELRRVAGSQLDAGIVEVFVDLLERSSVQFRHSTEADFEAELALERRARDYAEPRAKAAA